VHGGGGSVSEFERSQTSWRRLNQPLPFLYLFFFLSSSQDSAALLPAVPPVALTLPDDKLDIELGRLVDGLAAGAGTHGETIWFQASSNA